jgi:hypothetical protein
MSARKGQTTFPHVVRLGEWPKPERPGLWLFLGRRGYGKTTAACKWVRVLIERYGRALSIVHDPHGELDEMFGDLDVVRVASIEEADKLPHLPDVLIFGPEVDPSSITHYALTISDAIGDESKGLVLYIDELDRLTTPGGYLDDPPRIKGQAWEPGPVRRIINEGRHLGVDLVGTSRRPTALHVEVQDLSEAVWIFQTSGRRPLGWISEVCGDEYAEAAPHLSVGKHLLWTP